MTTNPIGVNLSIKASDRGDQRTYKFSSYFPRGKGYSVKSNASVTLHANVDDTLQVFVERNESSYIVFVGVDADNRVEMAQATYPANEEPVEFYENLLDAVQGALFTSFSTLVVESSGTAQTALPVANHATGAAIVDEPPRGRFYHVRRFAGRAVVVLAVILVGFGLYQGVIKKPAAPVTADAMATPDFSEMQEKIKQQITDAAKQGAPAVNGINGKQMDNVAIETMKAMGLDPGKANAGCLVGVK